MSSKDESKPIQIEPLLDPGHPSGPDRHYYYLLEKMHSPPIAPPNAIRWAAYTEPRLYLRGDDPNDTRVAYGFIEYDHELTVADLERYNMLPWDYEKSIVVDLLKMFDNNKKALLAYFVLFFKLVKDDMGLRRLNLVVKLVSREWTIKKAKEEVAKIDVI